jgi:hypothetical protein
LDKCRIIPRIGTISANILNVAPVRVTDYHHPPEVEILHAESVAPVNVRLGDLSRGGCYIETDCLLPLETEVIVVMKKSGEQVRAHARIVRAFSNKGVALAFTSMEGDGLRILDSWLAAFVSATMAVANRRGTERVVMSVEVSVSGYNDQGIRFMEETNTVEIGASGCSVILQTRVRRGQMLVLSNLQTNVTVESTVAHHNRKGTAWQVGLALIGLDKPFWPIVFPPADWSSRDPDAK